MAEERSAIPQLLMMMLIAQQPSNGYICLKDMKVCKLPTNDPGQGENKREREGNRYFAGPGKRENFTLAYIGSCS